MPLRRRKRTIRAAIRDVVIAPFVLILARTWTNRVYLMLIAVLTTVCMWMAREPLANLIPSMRTVYTILGVLTFVAVAAIPLAIRDYFSNGGFETVWAHSDKTTATVRAYAELLIARDFQSYYQHFSTNLRAEYSLNEFVESMAEVDDQIGAAAVIESVAEVEIPEHVFSGPDFDPSIDAIAQVTFAHRSKNKSQLTLCLNSTDSFQIVTFQHVNLSP